MFLNVFVIIFIRYDNVYGCEWFPYLVIIIHMEYPYVRNRDLYALILMAYSIGCVGDHMHFSLDGHGYLPVCVLMLRGRILRYDVIVCTHI